MTNIRTYEERLNAAVEKQLAEELASGQVSPQKAADRRRSLLRQLRTTITPPPLVRRTESEKKTAIAAVVAPVRSKRRERDARKQTKQPPRSRN